MKKITATFVLLFVLSFSVFADGGEYPIGGSPCPQGQTCFTGEYPIGGKTCPKDEVCATTEGEYPIGGKGSSQTTQSGNSIYQSFSDFLTAIFG